ncbi:MAG TPA: HAMP domain-containing sensor histidine kinase [Ktedonobacterales bacterium]|nr:HAMP domain-containing sensor histidine kinase [Ktedonobacterales bacterium]
MASEPPRPKQMSAGEPTLLLPGPEDARAARGGFHLWPRTVRWRLIASYALVLLVTLVGLGVALNVFISRTLYATEFDFFQSEAVAAVGASQSRFDALTLGQASTCAGALTYEEAFRQAIAQPIIASHPGGIQGVYLLDDAGNVLAPLADQTADNGVAPYLQMARLRALALRASSIFNGAPSGSGSRQLANVGYMVTSRGATYGVELIALRYFTDSRCAVAPARPALGYVEIVTSFRHTRVTLASLRIVILLVIAGIFALGLLLGGPLISAALAPLSRLTQTARRVASGDLSRRARLSHTDDEVGQLGVMFDAMLARIEAAFAATQRSEDRMRQFIADASHELRTPLTSIRGYTDVLLRGAKDEPETAERVLQAIRREAERMSRLVTDLLTLARLDTARPAERHLVDLIALAGESVDQARILAGERQVLIRSDGAGPLMAPGDPDQLKQVLLILLDNALKYGRQGPDSWVRLSVARRPSAAILTIEDNGPGIAPEDLPHIFERFYRAERAARARRITGAAAPTTPATPATPAAPQSADASSGKAEGSGLGLSIARAIAQAHGGALTAQSQPGAGTTFTLILPAAPGRPARGRPTEDQGLSLAAQPTHPANPSRPAPDPAGRATRPEG